MERHDWFSPSISWPYDHLVILTVAYWPVMRVIMLSRPLVPPARHLSVSLSHYLSLPIAAGFLSISPPLSLFLSPSLSISLSPSSSLSLSLSCYHSPSRQWAREAIYLRIVRPLSRPPRVSPYCVVTHRALSHPLSRTPRVSLSIA